MIKLIASVLLMIIAFFVYMLWLSGSHGKIQLRSNMLEDWIMAGIITICVIFSIWLFISWAIQNKKRRSGQ